MGQPRGYYRFRSQLEAELKFIDFGQYPSMQINRILKPIYRTSNGEQDIKQFAEWIQKQWNRETIQYQIVAQPRYIAEYWKQALAPTNLKESYTETKTE